jgi:hypothetical protein
MTRGTSHFNADVSTTLAGALRYGRSPIDRLFFMQPEIRVDDVDELMNRPKIWPTCKKAFCEI